MSTSRKVLVHVGAPKTGTSFLQDLLFQHREPLREQGILYPADRFDEHFLAALDLMELPWGGLEEQAVGAWDRLAARVREWPGTVIVSHEILAKAARAHVRRALASFGDAEVHIVYSARDLVRQLPAEWQENVKHRRVVSYHDFLAQVSDPEQATPLSSWFWGVQEVPDVLDRWGSTLPPAQVHLVTVPKPGAPRDLLWRRFASVLGLDPEAYDTTSGHANPSLGVPETALIRRLNEHVNGGVLANRHYREFVRELLAHRTLSAHTESARLSVPVEVAAWAAELSERWLEELAGHGYDVVGSLDELRPDPPTSEFADPDEPSEPELAEVSMAVMVTLLQEAGRLRDEVDGLREDIARAGIERDEALRRAGPILRAKRRFVRAADTNAAARWVLERYRGIRDNSSRSA